MFSKQHIHLCHLPTFIITDRLVGHPISDAWLIIGPAVVSIQVGQYSGSCILLAHCVFEGCQGTRGRFHVPGLLAVGIKTNWPVRLSLFVLMRSHFPLFHFCQLRLFLLQIHSPKIPSSPACQLVVEFRERGNSSWNPHLTQSNKACQSPANQKLWP